MNKLKLVNNLYYVVNLSTSCSNTSAIADTGASLHDLKVDAPHELVSRPVAPIQVKQPNGQILQSTKGCRLALSTLTEGDREANILPGLAHISLIPIGKLGDTGCESIFNQHTMVVTKDEQVVLQGARDVMTGLWSVPIHILDITTHQSNHLNQVNGKENSIKFLHAAAFSSVQDTWAKASIGSNSTHGRDSQQETSTR